MKKFNYEVSYTSEELDFPPFVYTVSGGTVTDLVRYLAESHNIVDADVDSVGSRILEIVDEVIENCFISQINLDGKADYKVVPGITTINHDGEDEIKIETFVFMSDEKMEFGEIRDIFASVDSDEIVACFEDMLFDTILDELHSTAPSLDVKASGKAVPTSIVNEAVDADDDTEEAEYEEVEVEEVEEVEAEEVEADNPSAPIVTLSDFSAEYLYQKFFDALCVENIQTAESNTWEISGTQIILNSLEFDDEEAGYIQRTVVKYDTNPNSGHRFIYTTVSQDGVVKRYDWRSVSHYVKALESMTESDDDAEFPDEVLSECLTKAACKSRKIDFIAGDGSRTKQPRIADAYADTVGELWSAKHYRTIRGAEMLKTSYYYILSPLEERSDVIVIEDGSVAERDVVKLDESSPKGKKLGLRAHIQSMIDPHKFSADEEIPRDVLVLLMVLGVAPKPVAVTEVAAEVDVAAEVVAEAENDNQVTTNNDNDMKEETPITTPVTETTTAVDDDPIAQMMAAAEALRRQQEQQMAEMMQRIQEAQEAKRRAEEEAKRRAEEARLKAREEARQQLLAAIDRGDISVYDRDDTRVDDGRSNAADFAEQITLVGGHEKGGIWFLPDNGKEFDEYLAVTVQRDFRIDEERRKEDAARKQAEAEAARQLEILKANQRAAVQMIQSGEEVIHEVSSGKVMMEVASQHVNNDGNIPAFVKDAVKCDQFDEIVQWVKSGFCVCLWGPAGSGKDITCMQVAQALGVKYYSNNCVLNTFDLPGYNDGHGDYHETELYKAWTRGGLWALTEIFASDPQVLNMLNEALSNGYMIFNNQRIRKHPQCYIMASDNTVGTGSTATYTGRTRIDEASINRFVLIEVGYNHEVEKAIAGGDNEIVEFSEDFRQACDKCGCDYVRSYRQTKMFKTGLEFMTSTKFRSAAKYINTPVEQCIHRCFHRYMSDSDFVLIAKQLKSHRNAYSRAMRNMADALEMSI